MNERDYQIMTLEAQEEIDREWADFLATWTRQDDQWQENQNPKVEQ